MYIIKQTTYRWQPSISETSAYSKLQKAPQNVPFGQTQVVP